MTSDASALPPFASQWLAQLRIGFERLEAMRREQLRNMTEQDAARIFEQLDPPRPYELRSGSGLIEQQRKFRQIWDRMHRDASKES